MNLNPNLKDIPPNSPRRQILKTALTFVTGGSTISLVSFLMPKSTKPAQAIVVQRPNEFELEGKGTYIKYSILNGVSQLDYRTQNISQHFSGEQIQTLDTDIGTLLTVIISKPPNPNIGGNIVKLSFFLPIINLAIGKKETSLLTEAILTIQKTSGFIRTPLFGQLQSYQTLALRGTARYH
ncbi:hypothetical protein [Nostoc sp. 'Peltigera malacea cyanobiont' DB3992]|uniref:hypothetical protein n=1 Tax=Nostoc sp. 'Peltigera malacea cyanobiont' DB3992 TaxID=1206980 RepID=UPI000C0451D2|nr:hypothetical protein [Nostoc sp. 'Peltigera malacea cyanobiont' DB3992]PHM10338.1 hypothetical protein CK516_09090 [Nostoc sp. 'Peltigera malacea cyanobiont' DB3992]